MSSFTAADEPRTLEQALADRLRSASHWLMLAGKRIELAQAHPEDIGPHLAAARHFLELAIKGVSP